VPCAFDLDHYRELLAAARAGGYRCAFFDREPAAGDLFLRHDVDMSLDAAVLMAELEASEGMTATYFLMTRGDFYNLGGPVGRRTIARLRELGHRIGLHAVHPDAELDARFDPVIAWHTPDPDFMTLPVDGALNVMQPPWFDPATYRSDSNQHWRSGCPRDELAAGSFPFLQLLVHPEIWVYAGTTMRETMEAFLDSDRDSRLALMRANRIEL
jgi:hypothetical protein